jgi:undecaprenyl phosphate-alpha-L-ara4N flippase subunit ArnF
MGYKYVFGTLLLTVYSQIILKWRISQLNVISNDGFISKIIQYSKLIIDPYIFSAFFSAFIASIFWMNAMSKLDITKAYPFMSLAPAIVFVFGIFFLGEQFTWGKVIGLIFIALGITISVKF